MNDVLFARSQMAMSLAFHIVFAAVGVAMPLLMVIAEAMWLRTGEREWLRLTHAWARGTAVLFAVGAVSGTVLSFELGLLFPGFMRHAGAVIGMPFSLEGVAFFTEAVFLGVYLYGWRRVSPRLHLAAGVMVALSGLASAVFVTLVNAWMNAPTGFRLDGSGHLVDIDPIAAMASPFALHETLHMAIAAYMATAIAVAAVHALALLRAPSSISRSLHRRALAIALAVAAPLSLVQPLVGHHAGQEVAKHQPLKLAAMESHYVTRARAPLTLGGIPDPDHLTVHFGVEVPAGLSLMAFGDADAVVRGLKEFPRADWPSPVVHFAFQIMVGAGSLLAAFALVCVASFVRRRRLPKGRTFLLTTVAMGPLGFIALETGWVVTETGRQPWTIYGVLRTTAAATPMHGLVVPFVTFSLVYLALAVVTAGILTRAVRATLAPVPAMDRVGSTP